MATHLQVAHAWAHKTGKQTTGHNLYYSGDTIYSYGRHFPIARHVTLPNGDAAVLFTTRSYSQSTSKHITYTNRACSHLRIIYVKDPSTQPGQDDITDLMTQAAEFVAKAGRARTNGPYYIERAAGCIEMANEIITAFALPIARLSLDSLGPDLQAIRDKAAADAAAAQARRVEDQRIARLAWQNGHTHRFYGTDEHGNAYMRVYGDQLQTSQGASVPLDDAKRVFELVARCRANSTTWSSTRSVVRVGDFTVDRIEPTGDFKAGCHTFAWSEIARVAQSIGLAV